MRGEVCGEATIGVRLFSLRFLLPEKHKLGTKKMPQWAVLFIGKWSRFLRNGAMGGEGGRWRYCCQNSYSMSGWTPFDWGTIEVKLL